MANIFDYLKDRGHISFEEDPFNEVDNVILAQLSYTDFDGIKDMEDGFLPVKEVQDQYFKINRREEVENRKTLVAQAPFLLDYLAKAPRFKDLKLGFYENIIDPEKTGQFSALVFDLPHMIYISYRGTDDTIVGWKEDFYFSFSAYTMGQKNAVAYADEVLDKLDKNKEIHLGGHSKGGNLATYAGVFCRKDLRDRIKVIWDNDGPGFSKEFLQKENYKLIKNKIIRIIPQTSIVGLLMENEVNPIIINSDASLILQHQAESWQVEGNRFVREKLLSKEAIFIEKSLTLWLEQIPHGQRRKFVDAVFACMEMAGYKTVSGLSSDGIKGLKNIKDAADNLQEDDQKIILKLLNMLIDNSRKVFRERLKERIKEERIKRKEVGIIPRFRKS